MQLKQKQLHPQAGITLVEMMVVVAIIAVMAFFAGPEMLQFGPKARLKSATQTLKSNLELARLEAVKRNTLVTARFTTSGCDTFPPVTPSSYSITWDDNGTPQNIPLMGSSSSSTSSGNTYTFPDGTALCGSDRDIIFTSRGYLKSTTIADEVLSLKSLEKDPGDPWYQITVSLGGAISIDRKEYK
ncbi:MAG: GspH/FimT family pseudopilin [Desulforhopalus sp.]|nr:GspH/FimT family pseudopilin [Desulforhopalus sp.]